MVKGRSAWATAAFATALVLVPLAFTASASAGSAGARVHAPAIDFVSGPDAGTVEVRARSGAPVALVSIVSGDGRRYAVRHYGADFSNPRVWVGIGAGALCWSERPATASTQYTVRAPAVPFSAPRAVWGWSSIVILDRVGPHRFARPAEGEVLTTGLRVRRIVACVDAEFSAARSARLESPPPSVPDPGTFAKPDDKITICHRTSSSSNPYNEITVDQSSVTSDNGHATHDGPLFPEPGWGDVIPPFEGYPGMNWPAGSLMLEDGCVPTAPVDPSEPPDIVITPPDPDDPVHPEHPIVIVPPDPGEPTPTATPTPAPTVTATVTATPGPEEPTPAPTASPPAATASASPSAVPTVTSAPVPVAVPAPGEVAFTLTDGFRMFTVERRGLLISSLAHTTGKCVVTAGEPDTQVRGC